MKEIIIKLEGRGHPRFYEILQELGELHDNKNTDYASKEDPLSNFNRTGKMLSDYNIFTPGYSAAKSALSYMSKQIDAVYKMVGEGKIKGKAEGVIKRLDDIAVYSIIIRIILEESIKKNVS